MGECIGKKLENKYNFIWKYIERPKRRISGFFNRHILHLDNRYFIQKEVNRHRYGICLYGFKLVRLIGWTDGFEDDYYYVCEDLRGEILFHSCVGRLLFFKRILSLFDYYDLIYTWNMNCHKSIYDIEKYFHEEYKDKNLL